MVLELHVHRQRRHRKLRLHPTNLQRFTLFSKSIAVLENFILAMIKYPEALRKAQEEIDSVIGHSRLPTFSDRPSLPYVEAMLTETLRWGCPVPLSTLRSISRWIPLTPRADFPYISTEEDVYDGRRIPKGSYVGISFADRNARLYLLPFYPSGTWEPLGDVER